MKSEFQNFIHASDVPAAETDVISRGKELWFISTAIFVECWYLKLHFTVSIKSCVVVVPQETTIRTIPDLPPRSAPSYFLQPHQPIFPSDFHSPSMTGTLTSRPHMMTEANQPANGVLYARINNRQSERMTATGPHAVMAQSRNAQYEAAYHYWGICTCTCVMEACNDVKETAKCTAIDHTAEEAGGWGPEELVLPVQQKATVTLLSPSSSFQATLLFICNWLKKK